VNASELALRGILGFGRPSKPLWYLRSALNSTATLRFALFERQPFFDERISLILHEEVASCANIDVFATYSFLQK
jgi:hypothetical protein